MFDVEDRARTEARILAWAHADARVVSAAVVGSRALTEGDRWSDLDLTFGVADGVPIDEVLHDWTERFREREDATALFDVDAGSTIYRVFLLPGCLQVDLSFTPAADFGARAPTFRLLYGEAVEREHAAPPEAHDLLGHGVHHALRARFCILRGRVWHAEYWLSALRDAALALACRRRDLPAHHGRGFDDLPPDVLATFTGALARSLDRRELSRALACAVEALLAEADEARDLARSVEPRLRELLADDDGGLPPA